MGSSPRNLPPWCVILNLFRCASESSDAIEAQLEKFRAAASAFTAQDEAASSSSSASASAKKAKSVKPLRFLATAQGAAPEAHDYAKCLNGHAMAPSVSQSTYCDVCGTGIEDGEHPSCAECDFDVHPACAAAGRKPERADQSLWRRLSRDVNVTEESLSASGFSVVKFSLRRHTSVIMEPASLEQRALLAFFAQSL